MKEGGLLFKVCVNLTFLIQYGMLIDVPNNKGHLQGSEETLAQSVGSAIGKIRKETL